MATIYKKILDVYVIKLRPSRKEELEQFIAFESEDDTQKFIMPYSHAKHIECFEDGKIFHLSITENEKLIGFFLLRLEDNAVEFRRIVITQSARGIGQQAIEKMHHFCAHELGVAKIWLDVFEYNARGRHIYSKMGYKMVGTQEYENKQLLIMEKYI